MKIVVSLNFSPNYVFYWLLVVSIAILIKWLWRLFSVYYEHLLQEYLKCGAYQTFLKITHGYKTIRRKKKLSMINI